MAQAVTRSHPHTHQVPCSFLSATQCRPAVSQDSRLRPGTFSTSPTSRGSSSCRRCNWVSRASCQRSSCTHGEYNCACLSQQHCRNSTQITNAVLLRCNVCCTIVWRSAGVCLARARCQLLPAGLTGLELLPALPSCAAGRRPPTHSHRSSQAIPFSGHAATGHLSGSAAVGCTAAAVGGC